MFHRGEGFHVNSSWTRNSFDQFEEVRVFQTCACGRCLTRGALHIVVASVLSSLVHASGELRLLHIATSWLKSKQRSSIHHISSFSPDERMFVVDSGASMQKPSKRDVSPAEMDTLR